ncbi:MAG: hypothetical protein EOO01_27365 [Chitinophagaceae bacterium]|nr:MAG: hypothetical protein EOO01_27365 [Chitinophagaceae bacterium]
MQKTASMKKIILCVAVAVFALACSNEADKSGTLTDSASNVVLPPDRSTDSLVMAPQGAGDSAGVKPDTSRR